MTGSVFIQVMRRSWWPILLWGGSAAAMAFLVVIIVPNVEALTQMADMLKAFPPQLLEMFGGEDVKFLATPEGYLSVNLFSWILLVFAAYAVVAGLGVTANEEEQGTMDVLVSLPIPRWRILLEKVLAYSLIIIAMIVLTWLGLAIGVTMTPAMAFNPTRLAEGTLNMIPGTLFILAFTVLMGTLARRRNTAAGIAGGYLVFSYVIDLLGRAAKGSFVDKLRIISFYAYHDNPTVMMKGLVWGNVIGLLVAAVVMIGIAAWAFEQRDVGV
jgi:ABC-2 type transport system permease protein